MFPFDVSGSVYLNVPARSNAAAIKAVANRIAAMLDEKNCTDVYVEGSRVRFHNAWFGNTISIGSDDFGNSMFSSFGSGTFDIEATIDGVTIRYRLGLLRSWLVLAFVAAVWAFWISVPLRGALQAWDTIWPFPLAPILAIAGLYSAFVWLRVKFWLRRGLRDLPELQQK